MNIVLDSNILLHYRNFEDIPWSKEIGCDDITIVLTAMVIEEIDEKKDNEKGKIQKKAKAVSSRIAEILLDGATSKIPVVYLDNTYATEDERRQYHLDRNDNQILFDVMKSDMEKENVTVVSSDNNMLIRAKKLGFKIHRLNDGFRLKEELSKEEKEAQTAIKELERLRNRMPKPILIFDNGENNLKIKRAVALNREIEVEKRVEELQQKWPEKTVEGEQYSVLGNTFSNASPEMIDQYNASRGKFIEDSEKKIRLEVERDDLQLRMKRISVVVYNGGNAPTGMMNVFVELPKGIEFYSKGCKKKVEFEEPTTPNYYPGITKIPSLFIDYKPHIEMWDMGGCLDVVEITKKVEPLNHNLQQGLITLYVDSSTCPNFKLKWMLVDAELLDPVEGELNVSFVEE